MPNPVVGNDRVLRWMWYDPLTGKPADAPSVVTIENSVGVINTYDVTTNPAVIHDFRGAYHFVWKPTVPDTYKYRVTCSGPFSGAIETTDTIDPSLIT